MFLIKLNNINLTELIKIHQLCDKDFVPKLSSRVNIEDYCKKLFNNANFVTINSDEKIIGLVAIYTNNFQTKEAYISSVCLLKEYRGKGLSKVLISETIKYTVSLGMEIIRLEVGIENETAKKLYESFNFYMVERRGNDTQIMELKLTQSHFV